MNIFKLYMKIAKSQRKTIMMYMCIFATLFIFFGSSMGKDSVNKYEQVKPDIALIDHDNTKLSNALKAYADKHAKIIDVGNTSSELKDALYFERVVYILEIPKGYEESFIARKPMELLAQSKPNDSNAILLQQAMNTYVSSMFAYVQTSPNASIDHLHELVIADQEHNVQMQFKEGKKVNKANILRTAFFNYLSYVLMAVCIMVVGLTLTSIHKSDVKMRNLIAPISTSSMNLQLLLANSVFGCSILACFLLIVFMIVGSNMFTFVGFLYCLNAFVFMIVCVTLGYFISVLVGGFRNEQNAINGISNVITLGSSFLCGAFVPQAFLSQGVLQISSFLPTYWYIKLSDGLRDVLIMDSESWLLLGKCLGVQLLFALTLLILALLFSKNKKSVQQISDTTK
ncbi:MAG: ABC transporter permease [Longicatena sp.]